MNFSPPANSTPKSTRRSHPGQSSSVEIRRHSSRINSISILQASSVETVANENSNEEMGDDDQTAATNNLDPESEEEVQSQQQLRQRADSTASDATDMANEGGKLKRKTTMSKQDVLAYFTSIDDYLKCNLCVDSTKKFSLNGSSDTNVRRHLGVKHHLKQFLYPSQLQEYESKPKQKFVSTAHKQQLDKAVVAAIYIDGRSFDDFRKTGMMKFLNLAIPGHSAIRLRRFISNELEKFKIKNKICAITTDNGPDIRAAALTTDFGIRLSCVAHDLNLTIKSALWLHKKPKKRKENTKSRDGEDIPEEYLNESSSENEEALTKSTIDDDDEKEESSLETSDVEEEYSSTLATDLEQDQFIERCVADETVLLLTLHLLLKRMRKLINFIHQSSVLDRYVKERIENKLQEINNRLPPDQQQQHVQFKDLIIDFEIRWNTTYLMLQRFLLSCSIITNITQNPSNEIGLKENQYEQLKKLAFSRTDWILLMATRNVLKSFYEATTTLSTQKYESIRISYIVITGLKKYLTAAKDEEPFENLLKQELLSKFNSYFGPIFISYQQCQASLICAFLDPALYVYLTFDQDELGKAEKLVLQRAEFRRISLQPPPLITQVTTANSSSSSRKDEQEQKQQLPSLSLNKFLKTCGIQELIKTTEAVKIKEEYTVKEQVAFYVANVKSLPNFETFWTKYGEQLPDLVSLVKHYSCMQSTSVSSESAFSISGYINRKTRCSLSSAALRFSMCLKKPYEDEDNTCK
ncbi:unnamed protein product [Rotaria magnacalcarata]|uniref:HAT C-terminal dimerisation domain-containing protein n=6 Tax=Rotaria magnacalcarata TaxID=392030 RepID=A0A816NCS8_9BILA|nr:unnamed protein product [Rotaria magnacalcarata]